MTCVLVKDRILYTRGKRCVEHVAIMRERFVEVLVGKVNAKGLIVRRRRRREDNIKWFFKDWGGDVE